MSIVIHVNSIVIHDDKILLVKEGDPENYGKWNFPGGHLEHNEKLVDCALRELEEEAGIKGTIKSLVGIYTGKREHHFINFIFHISPITLQAKPTVNDIIECSWFPMDELYQIEDKDILSPGKFRKILLDFNDSKKLPIEHIAEWIYP